MHTAEPPTTAETVRATGDGPQRRNAARDQHSYEEEIEALKRSLQEQRRATTLLNAEVQKQTEAREALEAQLIEANAEITASWDRRKEMTRVIADREAKLADAQAGIAAQQELLKLRAEIKESRERRKEVSRVVANRDAKIAELKAELQARYEELAMLQREVERSTLSGAVKRMVRPVSRLLR